MRGPRPRGGGSRRAELVDRLDRSYRGEGAHDDAPVTFPRRELESMTAAQLRTECGEIDLPVGCSKAAMVASVLGPGGLDWMRDGDRTEDGTYLDDKGRFVIHPWHVRPATRATLPEGSGPGEAAFGMARGIWAREVDRGWNATGEGAGGRGADEGGGGDGEIATVDGATEGDAANPSR